MSSCTRPNCPEPVLARGLCSSHYKKANHARILPPTPGRSGALVDATGSRRRVRDLMLSGHTSDAIAAAVGITGMEVRRIFSGRRLRVRADLAERIGIAHLRLEATPGDSVRTARWALAQGWRTLDTYAEPDDPDSPRMGARGVLREEIEHLLPFGLGDERIADMLGCTLGYIALVRRGEKEARRGA